SLGALEPEAGRGVGQGSRGGGVFAEPALAPAGLRHFEDLNTPVWRHEADAIQQMVDEVLRQVLPGATVILAGGFRRGKLHGHDVDLLITHPVGGLEVGLLPKVMGRLESKGLVLYRHAQGPKNPDHAAFQNAVMDDYEKCFSILWFPKSPTTSSHLEAGESSRDGKAVRVDLVVAPISQFAFALLGWTGSQVTLKWLLWVGGVGRETLKKRKLLHSLNLSFLIYKMRGLD
ncbi:DNA-directed DNA/RNA polymerase mu-like, partial [Gracilinanus agilis]|uniref:DNA-directed DNA/RNA polymerase mu-like n=1 Tax=Gracilinanus agilis TaxID=191870 RepID=UPI001CFC47A0